MGYSANLNLIPQPKQIQLFVGNFELTPQTSIMLTDSRLTQQMDLLIQLLQPATSFNFKSDEKQPSSVILLKYYPTGVSFIPESYELEVQTHCISITAGDNAGFWNAFQTLLQLLPANIYGKVKIENIKWSIQNLKIIDYPLYSWRGAMLDVSRQFYSLSFLKSYIDWMAVHKLNIFHIHLTDDEGWRIEIKAYPNLTKTGAWRGPGELLPPAHGSGEKRYGGFYTQDEMKELIQYAKERNIQILPEIDIPGHSRSVAVSYPEILCDGNDSTFSVQGVRHNVWCAGNEHNFEMLDTIFGEISSIFSIPYFHIGGDEVNHNSWDHCSKCREYMSKNNISDLMYLQSNIIERVEKMIEKHGKIMIGWNEILNKSKLNSKTTIMAWNPNEAVQNCVNNKQPVIICPASYFYLDMKQGMNEKGYNWASNIPIERLFSYKLPTDSLSNEYVIGVQGNLWSECLDEPIFQTEYQSYPRLCAVAELAWSGNSTTFESFKESLYESHFDRLFMNGIHFRVPSPKLNMVNGKIYISDIPDHSIVLFDSVRNEYRTCFRDTLISPPSQYCCVNAGLWNPEYLRKFPSNKFCIELDSTLQIDSTIRNFILQYEYGSIALEIKKVRIFTNDSLFQEIVFSEPVQLVSSTPICELKVNDLVISPKDKCRIEIETLERKDSDSYGVILIK